MTRRLATLLLRLTARIAPTERRPWIQALRAEADVIEGRAEALGWAVGGLFAALGWLARREGRFVLVLLAVAYGQLWIAGGVIEIAEAMGVEFLDAAFWVQIAVAVLLSTALAIWRPRRGLAIFLMMPVFSWLFLLYGLLDNAGRPPIPWSFALWTLIFHGGPAAVGAAVGWFIRFLWPASRSA